MGVMRFDRLEQKIDKLTDAVTAIARVEEKIMASNMRLDRVELRLDKLEDDMDSIATIARSNMRITTSIDKFSWLILGALVSIGVWLTKAGVSG